MRENTFRLFANAAQNILVSPAQAAQPAEIAVNRSSATRVPLGEADVFRLTPGRDRSLTISPESTLLPGEEDILGTNDSVTLSAKDLRALRQRARVVESSSRRPAVSVEISAKAHQELDAVLDEDAALRRLAPQEVRTTKAPAEVTLDIAGHLRLISKDLEQFKTQFSLIRLQLELLNRQSMQDKTIILMGIERLSSQAQTFVAESIKGSSLFADGRFRQPDPGKMQVELGGKVEGREDGRLHMALDPAKPGQGVDWGRVWVALEANCFNLSQGKAFTPGRGFDFKAPGLVRLFEGDLYVRVFGSSYEAEVYIRAISGRDQQAFFRYRFEPKPMDILSAMYAKTIQEIVDRMV